MPRIARNRYQNTTLRMPRQIYQGAKRVVSRFDVSFNDFVLEAIEEKLQRLSEQEIDMAFAQMAEDNDYQRSAIEMAREFEKSDWEAQKVLDEPPRKAQVADAAESMKASRSRKETISNARSSKARSR